MSDPRLAAAANADLGLFGSQPVYEIVRRVLAAADAVDPLRLPVPCSICDIEVLPSTMDIHCLAHHSTELSLKLACTAGRIGLVGGDDEN